MDVLMCKICDKSFSGEIPLQQHKESEKHKKKHKLFLMSKNADCNPTQQLISCPVCSVDFPGIEKYQSHVNSLEHALRVQSKNEKCSSTEPSLELPDDKIINNASKDRSTPILSTLPPVRKKTHFYEACDLCSKQFTGMEPYEQHLESQGHKRKVAMQQFIVATGKSNDESVNASLDGEYVKILNSAGAYPQSFIECKLCEKTFTGREPYAQHLECAAHRKKVASRATVKESNHDAVLDPEYVRMVSVAKAAAQPYAKCFMCQMEFVDQASYHLHLRSDVHKKGEVSLDTSADRWRCDVCNLNCTGPIPYEDHMRSRAHGKKALAARVFKSSGGNVSLSEPDSTVKEDVSKDALVVTPNSHGDAFKKQSTCSIPHQYHVNSCGNELSVEAGTNFKRNAVGCSEHQTVSGERDLNDKLNTFSKRVPNDLLLIGGLDVVPQEVLNDIGVFKSHEKVSFDSNKKKNEVLPKVFIDFPSSDMSEESMTGE